MSLLLTWRIYFLSLQFLYNGRVFLLPLITVASRLCECAAFSKCDTGSHFWWFIIPLVLYCNQKSFCFFSEGTLYTSMLIVDKHNVHHFTNGKIYNTIVGTLLMNTRWGQNIHIRILKLDLVMKFHYICIYTVYLHCKTLQDLQHILSKNVLLRSFISFHFTLFL